MTDALLPPPLPAPSDPTVVPAATVTTATLPDAPLYPIVPEPREPEAAPETAMPEFKVEPPPAVKRSKYRLRVLAGAPFSAFTVVASMGAGADPVIADFNVATGPVRTLSDGKVERGSEVGHVQPLSDAELVAVRKAITRYAWRWQSRGLEMGLSYIPSARCPFNPDTDEMVANKRWLSIQGPLVD